MKTFLMPLILSALALATSLADEDGSKSVTVTSKLGQGFGKMIEIEGRLVETRERNIGNYKESIKVHWVNNKKIDPPVLISVSMLSLIGEGALPEEGDWIRIRGFESGGFSGFPKDAKQSLVKAAFSRSPRMEFRFRTYFAARSAQEPKHDEVISDEEEAAAREK
ncbi:MAG: hypothetical protein ACR2RV_15305 [Verrucomicrobiales bacterium]